MKPRHGVILLAAALCVGAVAPAYLRVYRVVGSSDAPSFLPGDRILVVKTAYDLRLPYTDVVVVSHTKPQPGDVVMFHPPDQDLHVFKRIVGCPGDSVMMRDNHLEINEKPLQYVRTDEPVFKRLARGDVAGAIIEIEIGLGPPHRITYSPDTSRRGTFGPIRLPAGRYFVLGDSRDNSTDSRMYGSIPRRSIIGKVVHLHRSES